MASAHLRRKPPTRCLSCPHSCFLFSKFNHSTCRPLHRAAERGMRRAMFQRFFTTAALLALTSAGVTAVAQEQGAAKPQEATQPNIPRPVGQLMNVKLELTI